MLAEAGTGVWGQWWPRPPCTSQKWCLAFQVDHASSRGIPGHTYPYSRPLCCICSANSAPLLGPVLPTPCFSSQTLPASADSCPRQGCPRLIPKEPLGWGGAQASGAHAGGGDPSPRGGWACSDGSPSQYPQRLMKPAGGERGCNGGYTPCTPLKNDTLLLRCPGFFRRLSQLWSSLFLSLQSVFSQPTAVSSLGLCSKPHFPAPSPPSQQATHNSGWNVQSCNVDHACSSYFVLPSTDHPLHSPLIP